MLRTGAPCRDLPERFGPWSTAWSRFRRWTAGGVWRRLLEALRRGADCAGRLDPLALVLSGGERHESLYVGALLHGGHVRRAGRGRPRVRPLQLVVDKGDSYPTVRRTLARRGIRAVIPRRSDQRPGDRRYRPLERTAYRSGNRVECLVNRLKQSRRVATRYGKRAAHYLAMLTLAALRLWL